MDRAPGLSVRLKLTLSYAGFLMLAGALLLGAVWLVLLRYPPAGGPMAAAGGLAPGTVMIRGDALVALRVLFGAFAPTAAIVLAFLLVFGLLGGWVLAGRMLAPLTRVSDAARLAATGSLSHRIGLPGRRDEFRELADVFDTMLARLEAHVAEQRRFAANASHELRTPLAITQTLLDVARNDPNRDTGELVDRLHAVNTRAIDLTEALLLLSRADQRSFTREHVDLSLIAEEATETLLPLAEKRGVTIETSGDATPTTGSHALLLQLGTNLVHNAIVHNLPEQGTVWVTTSVHPEGAVLAVENTGQKLTSELAATLAEPFVRGAERIRTEHAGVGLGLAIVKSITQAHAGTLTLTPRSAGGLRVTVQLPATAPHAGTELAAKRPPMRMFFLLAFLLAFVPPNTALAQQPCSFQLGFKAIADQIPDRVGSCLEDEHFNVANGNAEQRTTAHHGQGGLLVWRKSDNWTAFTDGHWTWVNGPNGLQRRLNAERFPWENDAQTPTAKTRLGIYGWSPEDASQRASIREAGMTVAQVAVDWNALEFDEAYHDLHAGKPGSFEGRFVGALDARVRAVADGGVEPILLVTNPPAWALQVPQTQGPLKPEKTAKYADFVARLVQRYPQAKHVVLWPEPDHKAALPEGCNVALHHRAWGDAPEQFAAMLKTTYPVVKAARPDVQVIVGALAYDNFAGRCGAFAERFLDGVLAAGGGDAFDVFAFNSYAIFSVLWEERVPGQYDVAAKASYLRAKYPSLGAKPTMVLEAGVWSDPSVPIPVRLPDGTIGTVVPDAAWQAAYPAKLIARAQSAGLSAVLWYGLRDYEGDVQRGLLDRAGNAKPSLNALRHASSRLGNATYVGPLRPAAVHSGTVEGYVFAQPDGSRLTVLWAAGDQSARARVTLEVANRVEDAFGSPLPAATTLDVGPSPVFVT